MPRGLWVKTSPTNSFSAVKNFFVKISQTSWVSVLDAWVKVSPTSWQSFFTAGTAPDFPIEILNSFNTSEEIRLQGKNYKWTPAPTTLQYKFSVVNQSTQATIDLIPFTTTTNPTTSTILPTSTTYQTVTAASGNYYKGVNNIFRFAVRGTTASGAIVDTKAEYSFRIPAAPTLSVTPVNSTSVTLSITAATTDDFIATGRYIVYRFDATSGLVYGTSGGTNGLGGISAGSTTVNTTITGLVAGRQYIFYVLPVTGTTGFNLTNYTGYPGTEANTTYTIDTGYTFAFGNDLYVSTNGYIGINGVASANGSDALPTTGEYLAVMSRDLQQSSTTSVWYWSDTSKYTVRWEGFDFGASASTKTYQVTFYSGQNYADVYVLLKNGLDGNTTAHYKSGVVRSSYSSALLTGAMRRVYFDGTPPATITGLTEQNKASMKQVTGLTSGSVDVGYTTLTTATNQTSFTPGTISVSGGSPAAGTKYVTRGSTLTITPNNDWPAGTTFSYQWLVSRSINGLPELSLGTTNSQSSTSVGERLYAFVYYANSSLGIPTTYFTVIDSHYIVPPAPTYTLTNNNNGTFTVSNIVSTSATGYYGTWGASGTIASASSPTPLANSTTVTSGNGSISVTLYSSVLITYSGGSQTRYSSWESTTNSVTVTTITPQSTGQMRRVTMPVTFTNSSQTVWVGTNGYVSVTVDPTTAPGTTWPPAGGTVVGPAVADLRQTSLSYLSDSANFYVRWQGCALGEIAGSTTIDYLMKFYWNSSAVDVYFINNSTIATLSLEAVRNGNTLATVGGIQQTWANSTSITGMTIPGGMTSDATNNNVDDNRTAITATKPLLNLVTNPSYGTATSASGGWSASISTQPNPTGGTYSIVTYSAGNFPTINSTTGAVTVTGLAAGTFSTVTVRYSLSGYNSVDIIASGSSSGGGVTAPGIPTSVALSGSGLVSWAAPASGGTPTSYEIEFFTATNGTGTGALPTGATGYTVTGITTLSYQLGSAGSTQYASPNNWARVRVRARNTGGVSSYSAWVPSATTYS